MVLEAPTWLHNLPGGTVARVDRRLIEILLSEGVVSPETGALKVSQRAAGANMSVDIAPGIAVVTGDDQANQGRYTTRSTAVENRIITAAPASGARITTVVARVRDSNVTGSADDWVLETVDGPVSTSTPPAPLPPAVPNTATPLADIWAEAGMASITDGTGGSVNRITDRRAAASLPLAGAGPDIALVGGARPFTGNLVAQAGVDARPTATLDHASGPTSWPTGYSQHLASGSGWALGLLGTVETFNWGASSRTHQRFTSIDDPPRVFLRRRASDTTWTGWVEATNPPPVQAVEDLASTLNRVGWGAPDGTGPGGPSLSAVRCSAAGRLMVDWGARMRMTTTSGYVLMGWQLTSDGAPVVAAADSRAVWVAGLASYVYTSRRHLVTGLDPAVAYTLTAVYRNNSDALTGEVAYRYLTAHAV